MHHDFKKLADGNYAYLAWEPLAPETAARVRRDNFDLAEQGLSQEEAVQECGRCLRCDHYGKGAFRNGRVEKW